MPTADQRSHHSSRGTWLPSSHPKWADALGAASGAAGKTEPFLREAGLALPLLQPWSSLRWLNTRLKGLHLGSLTTSLIGRSFERLIMKTWKYSWTCSMNKGMKISLIWRDGWMISAWRWNILLWLIEFKTDGAFTYRLNVWNSVESDDLVGHQAGSGGPCLEFVS